MYFAHFCECPNGERKLQTVEEHCRNSARFTQEALLPIGLGEVGYICGLLHDLGKMKQEFSDYLLYQKGARGSVNHTFAGCRMVLELFHNEMAQCEEDLSAELIAYAIGAHHGQFDCIDEDGRSGFLHRMEKANIGYTECKLRFLERCASLSELRQRFHAAHSELMRVYEKIATAATDHEEYAFHLSLLARLLLSAVIDGDRRDTAEFMSNITYPEDPTDPHLFWDKYLAHMEKKLDLLPQNTDICRARRMISDQCRAFANEPCGIYRLNVPTGSGKTLSSLRYALAHAKKWGKKRLIFTSPLLSILEQNASVIKDYLGDDTIILEHHSNVIKPKDPGELDERELAVDTWNAPVIITTLVQLLDTLFDGKTTAIRRFQSLCNSVIVIDEVQTVPIKMLTLFDLAIDFLSEVCGATVLLCSATQPCLEKAERPMRQCKGDVVPFDETLWNIFRRTEIKDRGPMDLEQIAAFAQDILEASGSLLIVCNKKSEAHTLFHALDSSAQVCRHLSASMCIAHRRKTLAELERALEEGKSCLCVATQVIEAGVDISFARVIRLAAGLDSVIQAAGRCNRHGENATPVPVYLVRCTDERLSGLREIEEGKKATISLLEAFRRDPEEFDRDLSSDLSVGYYYRKLYGSMAKGAQDFTVKSRRTSLFQLLACNLDYYHEDAPYVGRFMLTQAFKTAGSLFRVFDDETQDVVVPYGEGAALILELSGRQHPDPGFLWDWLQRAKPYTVSVYDHQIHALSDALTDCGGVMVLAEGYYDEQTGLGLKPGKLDYLEV